MLERANLCYLAELFGIQFNYHSAFGEPIEITTEVLQKHFVARGIACADDNDVAAAIVQRQLEIWNRPAPALISVSSGTQPQFTLRLPSGVTRFAMLIRREDGSENRCELLVSRLLPNPVQKIADQQFRSWNYCLPVDLPDGFHDLTLTYQDQQAPCQSKLIVGPDSVWQPPGGRVAQAEMLLGSIRSHRPEHLGRGNFGDLATGVRRLRGSGVRQFTVGPITCPDWPWDNPSATPFMVLSNLLLNHLHTDVVAAINRLRLQKCLDWIATSDFQSRRIPLCASDVVNPNSYDQLLLDCLEKMWKEFRTIHLERNSTEAREFESFIAARGETILGPATFLVLRQHYQARQLADWWLWSNWEQAHQDPQNSQISDFRQQHWEEIRFVLFCQWLVHRDLQEVAAACEESGLDLGLMVIMTIGEAVSSAETWQYSNCYFSNLRRGVPPDPLDRNGQSWNYPAENPDALLEAGLSSIIEKFKLMFETPGVGGCEIDHGMWVDRGWFYPADGSAKDGVFITFPLEEIMRAIALLSHRYRKVISSELVGTKSETIDEVMNQWGVLSIYQQRFEMRDEKFLAPAEYKANARVVGTTHNTSVEPLWLLGADIRLRAELLGKSMSEIIDEWNTRKQQIALFLGFLVEHSGLDRQHAEALQKLTQDCPEPLAIGDFSTLGELDIFRQFSLAAHRSRAQTPSRIVQVSLKEASLTAADLWPDNLPGIWLQYPCWLRKGLTVELWNTGNMANVFRVVHESMTK